ncbi:hypothetical protein MKZ38_009245 [Zalerion maritima]|uniref:Uncharacterized protein n=1 Tax=Zalerion maritima TaxID=339359 RepID=A0AAD5WV75_9PEZI|nr:hypothetical protein MKZ38_009245 [Zalerion maritima]
MRFFHSSPEHRKKKKNNSGNFRSSNHNSPPRIIVPGPSSPVPDEPHGHVYEHDHPNPSAYSCYGTQSPPQTQGLITPPAPPTPPTAAGSWAQSDSAGSDNRRSNIQRKPLPSRTATMATSITAVSNTEAPGPSMLKSTTLQGDSSFAQSDPLLPLPEAWRGQPLWTSLTELLNLLLAMGFLVVGFLIASLNGKTESKYAEQIVEMSLTLPTLWPIVFAAVVGSTVKTWAHYKVERGIQLSRLEALMGSQTLAGTIKTILLQRSISISTFTLLVVWVFSPLGSQAFLRGISLHKEYETGTAPLTFLNYTLAELIDLAPALVGSSGFASDGPAWSLLYGSMATSGDIGLEVTNISDTAMTYGSAADLYPENVTDWHADFETVVRRVGGVANAALSSAQDTWANVKIPNLRRLEGYDGGEADKWVHVPWRDRPVDHASLVGFPVRGIEKEFSGNLTFQTTYTYYGFDCDSWNTSDWVDDRANLSARRTAPWMEDHWRSFQFRGPNSSFALQNNFSADMDLAARDQSLNITDQTNAWAVLRAMLPLSLTGFLLDTPDPFPDGTTGLDLTNNASICNDTPQRTVYFGQVGLWQAHFTECKVNAVPVDMEVFCEARGESEKLRCGAQRMRRQEANGCSDQFTVTPFDYFTMGAMLMNEWPGLVNAAEDDAHPGAATLTEMVLWNPARVDLGNQKHGIEMGDVPIDVFSDRLTLVFNTALMTAIDSPLIMGNLDSFENLDASVLSTAEGVTTQNVTATTVFEVESRYRLSAAWIAIYFTSSAVMFLAAVGTVVLRMRCRAPEILGYVSSMARGNEWFRSRGLESTGVRTGMDVGKELNGTVVRVGDVYAEAREDMAKEGKGGLVAGLGAGAGGLRGYKVEVPVGRIAFAPADMVGAIEKGRMYI